MKLHEEFKLYENMWDTKSSKPVKCCKRTSLKESRNVADIEADITRLERELAAAKAELVATKKANLGGKRPKYLYTWDMYINKEDKGSWMGADNKALDGDWDGALLETEAEAIEAGRDMLKENPELLDGPIEAYTIDTIAIPIKEVSDEQLEYLGLAHLIESVGGKDKEYAVTYRLTTWPDSDENEDALLYAESEADARENFLNYMFDVDNYDADDVGDMPAEDEVKIISIKATGK